MDTEDVLDRFRGERQILANLEHPYIARLLDGGSTVDGRPFLVMEYVQGEALDSYSRDLTVRDRCKLFLKVCEAVAFAHRNLVIHRDLKPGNILVTADGTPKLLDFGVAKLLDATTDSGRTQTVVAMRRITPEYASPDQIRADRMTTATDVYSLGGVLYEILTGKRPHKFSNYSPREIERVICEEDPTLPSVAAPKLQKQLSGDLDAIVSKAMRKEPSMRYASVEQLAADVERYLNGWEVSARQGNFRYRIGKLLRRHRTGITVGAMFAAVLIGGTVVATREAILAERAQRRAEDQSRLAMENQTKAEANQREAETQASEAVRQRRNADMERHEAELQRIAAETQRQLAERRFSQVRQLAGKFLFEFHDSIAKLAGSTPARKMVVQTGLEYYDGLVRDAQGNRELLEEIARGYDRMGDVQGNPYYANLGDVAGALASYKKAVAVRDNITDPSADFLRDRIQGHTRVAQILTAQGNMKDAEAYLKEAIAFASSGPASNDYKVRDALANLYNSYGGLKISLAAFGEAEAPLLKLLEISEQLAKEGRDPAAEQAGISLAHTKLGDVYERMERNVEAVQHLRLAIGIDRQLSETEPNNLPRARKLYISYILMSRALRGRRGDQLGSPAELAEFINGAAELADRMSIADPTNNLALTDVVNARTLQGDWLRQQNDANGALISYKRAVTATEKLDGPNVSYGNLDAIIQSHHRLSTALVLTGQPEAALESLSKAEAALARAEKINPGTMRSALRHADIARTRGEVYASQANWPNSISNYKLAISIYETQRSHDPKNETLLNEQPDLYSRLADSYSAAGQNADAVKALQAALTLDREIESQRPLVKNEEDERQSNLNKLAQFSRK